MNIFAVGDFVLSSCTDHVVWTGNWNC